MFWRDDDSWLSFEADGVEDLDGVQQLYIHSTAEPQDRFLSDRKYVSAEVPIQHRRHSSFEATMECLHIRPRDIPVRQPVLNQQRLADV